MVKTNLNVKEGDILKEKTEMIVVGFFEGLKAPRGAAEAVDKALSGVLSKIVQSGEFTGKFLKTTLLRTGGKLAAEKVLVVGLGKWDEYNMEKVRQAAGRAATEARELGVKEYATVIFGGGHEGTDIQEACLAMAEGSILALYEYDRFKTKKEDKDKEIKSITIMENNGQKMAKAQKAVQLAQVTNESVYLVRDLVNTPSNELTPTKLGLVAKEVAKKNGLACKVMEPKEIQKLKMGGLLSVAKGSDEPPRFIVLEHGANHKEWDTIVIVGKGITFDSGGISLKPAEKMEEMKGDMAGAGVVLGVLQAVAKLKLPLHVVGLAPATENLPSGHATKPGDIVMALNGKTIEVINTDAEGRVILADALSYAKHFKPKAVIDLATLTGACVVALGHEACGLLGSDQALMDKVKKASEQTGERAWPLPMYEEYAENIKSDLADIKNVGARGAGTITGAMFLKHFTEGYAWAHLDIAGTAFDDKAKPYIPKGGTGFGVRLLVQFLRNWAGVK